MKWFFILAGLTAGIAGIGQMTTDSKRNKTSVAGPQIVTPQSGLPWLKVKQSDFGIQSFECQLVGSEYILRYTGDMGSRQWKGALDSKLIRKWKALAQKISDSKEYQKIGEQKSPTPGQGKINIEVPAHGQSLWLELNGFRIVGDGQNALQGEARELASRVVEECRRLAKF